MLISSLTDVSHIPSRIISAVPSITELLSDLGLDKETIGITKFCVHPQAWFRSKTRIGGTKQLNIEKIRELNPDLIICNREENVAEQVLSLAADFPVYVTDVETVDHALEMIQAIGRLTSRSAEAGKLVAGIRNDFSAPDPAAYEKKTAAYFIWKDPYMTVGADTFISDMMLHAGLENVYADSRRYPEVLTADLQARNPQLLLLASEPYPFTEKHITEMRDIVPDATIFLVDGEMFSWYGSRMRYAADYFKFLRNSL